MIESASASTADAVVHPISLPIAWLESKIVFLRGILDLALWAVSS